MEKLPDYLRDDFLDDLIDAVVEVGNSVDSIETMQFVVELFAMAGKEMSQEQRDRLYHATDK